MGDRSEDFTALFSFNRASGDKGGAVFVKSSGSLPKGCGDLDIVLVLAPRVMRRYSLPSLISISLMSESESNEIIFFFAKVHYFSL
jgi:hypothetical protein